MAKTLQEVLNTDLSPDKMGDFTPNELADFLVKNNIVAVAVYGNLSAIAVKNFASGCFKHAGYLSCA
jgi:hypothetical protein